MKPRDEVQHHASTNADQTDTEQNAEGATEVVVINTVIESDAGDGEQQTGSDQDEQKTASDEQQHVDTSVDAEAPWGRKADGTPRQKRGPKPKAVAEETAKQRAKLRSVTQSTYKPDRKKVNIATVSPLTVVNYQAMGDTAANLFFNIGTMAVGPDWEPDVAAGEPQAVSGAFRDYFKATNMRDMPPAFALCVVLALYTMKRVNKPTVQNKLQLLGAWVKTKIPRRRNIYVPT